MTTRIGATVDAIDMFCGFGGSSQGIHSAGADVRLAANHDAHAIEVHAANFPDTEHLRADISDPDASRYTDPRYLPAVRFMWASPSCRFHSPANARKVYQRGPCLFDDDVDFDHDRYARSERSRVTMMCPLRYAAHNKPEAVIVENVVEAAKWGPDRDGSTFRWWLHEWEKIGYRWRACFLNSRFFPPTPQSRDRMYVVFWRAGNPAPDLDYRPVAYCISDVCGGRHVEAVQTWKRRTKAWPLDQWGKYGQQYDYRCPECAALVDPLSWPAYTAIDWSDLGTPIAERTRPLAAKTIERIRRGLAKYVHHPAFTLSNITAGRPRTIAEPLSTQVTTSRDMLIKGIIAPVAGNTSERPGQTRARPLDAPWFTQHATGGFGFAHLPVIHTLRGSHDSAMTQAAPVINPVGTVSAGGIHHGLSIPPALWAKQNGGPGDTAWHLTDQPLNTITERDTTGLIVLPWIDQWRSNPVAISEQLATVMTKARHALASIPVTSIDPDAIDLDAVRFRMLQPDPEIRRAMAFDDTYILLGNKTQRTAGLGNAVTPPVAGWLTQQVLTTLAGP